MTTMSIPLSARCSRERSTDMKRACYLKRENGYVVKRLRSINSDGTLNIENIKSLDKTFSTLEDMFITAN